MKEHLHLLMTGVLMVVVGIACETTSGPMGTENAQVMGATGGEGEREEARAEGAPTKNEPVGSALEIRHKVVSDTEEEPVAEVGAVAPDFTLTAYHEGAFKQVSLSDYRGEWVLLCFYPGDFTFV
jgi:peroxiredoxin (alkyl hydroperoxide reductase subunit C)